MGWECFVEGDLPFVVHFDVVYGEVVEVLGHLIYSLLPCDEVCEPFSFCGDGLDDLFFDVCL